MTTYRTSPEIHEMLNNALRERAELLAALQAIEARVSGVFDSPKLLAFGPLSTSTADDCLNIARAAIAKATGGA